MMTKVLVAMSGGVDSSVAARLLKNGGYECVGCTMKLFGAGGESEVSAPRRTCCSEEDVELARSAAYKTGMPYYVFNFSDAFREKVMEPFAREYEAGRTPNPCIDCNRYMKFAKLFERADILGCRFVATGHYARVERGEGGRFLLKKAVFEEKDQSYVLYTLTQSQLSRLLLPLGGLKKSEVREIAEESGFPNAQKPESQDICFVPDGDYAGFITRFTGREYPPGDFVDGEGKVLGRHKGIIRYTVGQRRGLGVSAAEPLYVKKIDPAANTVTLCPARELAAREVIAEDFNWISGEPPKGEVRCTARLRYRQPEHAATVTALEGGAARIVFDESVRTPAAGQAAVLYEGDVVLGGGTITFTKNA